MLMPFLNFISNAVSHGQKSKDIFKESKNREEDFHLNKEKDRREIRSFLRELADFFQLRHESIRNRTVARGAECRDQNSCR